MALPRSGTVPVNITKQTNYSGVMVDVAELQEGVMTLIITNPVGGEQIFVPMPAEVARTVGHRLIAPHVQVAPSNGKH